MNSVTAKFLTAAKAIVYSEQRAEIYLPLLDTRQGSVEAVMHILSALDGKKKIPRESVPLIAVHVYLMMVDVAMAATGDKPNKDVMKQTTDALLQATSQAFGGGNGPAN
jgi:hypothetical protein